MKLTHLFIVLSLITFINTPLCAETQIDNELFASGLLHELGGDDTFAFFGFTPRVDIIDSPLLDAYVTKAGKIAITQGFHNLLESDRSEYAFLLAHEIAHHVLNHHRSARFQGTKSSRKAHMRRELAADAMALELLEDAGFDKFAGHRLLQKIINYASRNQLPMGSMYPSLKLRLSKLPHPTK